MPSLDLEWEPLEIEPLPVGDLDPDPEQNMPDPDKNSLADLAERYAPEVALAANERGRRPPRWDDPRLLTMLGHLETGLDLTDAIAGSGLAERTVYRWLEDGRTEHDADIEGTSVPTIYRHVWQCVMRAKGVSEARALQTIRQAASRGAWRAAAWFLERRYPDKWGRNSSAWRAEQEAAREIVTVEELDAKLMGLIAEARLKESASAGQRAVSK